MEYNKEFSDAVRTELNSQDFEVADFDFDVSEGFKTPPVLEVIRFMGSFDNEDAQEKNARWCIMGRTVKLKVDGEYFGSGFTFTDMNAPWDLYPEIKAYPLALKLLFELAGAFVAKNSMPSRKKSPVATATVGTPDTLG
jgi:hypothetical protein